MVEVLSDYDPSDDPLEPCDGSGELHFCHRNIAPFDGPHAWCDDMECPGCENCAGLEPKQWMKVNT